MDPVCSLPDHTHTWGLGCCHHDLSLPASVSPTKAGCELGLRPHCSSSQVLIKNWHGLALSPRVGQALSFTSTGRC